MIKLTIADKSYSLKSESKDFTLKEYIEFNEVVLTIPESLKEYYAALLDGKEYEKQYSYIEWIDFYDRVFKFFSNYKEKNTKLSPEDLSAIYNNHLTWIVIKTLYPSYDAPGHAHEPITTFTLDKVEYKLLDKFMRDGSIEQYGEVEDSFNNTKGLQDYYTDNGLKIELDKIINGNLKAYPYMLGILYRPKGEDYSEKLVGERAKAFMKLKMDIVWGVEVFFWTQTTTYIQNMQSSSKNRSKQAKKRRTSQTLNSSVGITNTK